MLKRSRLLALAGLTTALALGYVIAEERPSQETTTESSHEASEVDIKKLSEAFGHFIGRNINAPGLKFDLDSIIKGMREGAEGKPAPMNDQEYEAAMLQLQEKAFNQMSEENLKTANDFLEKNSKENNVVVLEPGKLQYIIVQEGHDPAVSEHGSPLVQYKGTYLDGTVFGSSEDVGGPLTVPLDQTIPGFSRGIVGMKTGEKRKIFVHPDLGYGTSGQLAPNSLLIFEVEVVKPNGAETTASENSEHKTLALSDDETDDRSDESDEESDENDSDDNNTPSPINKLPTTK